MPTPDRSWMRDAACVGFPPEWWCEQSKRGWTTADNARALKICFRCPVRQQCVDYALAVETDWPWCIWGGLPPKARQRLGITG